MILNILVILTIAILIYFAFLNIWCFLLLLSCAPDIIKKFQEATYGGIEQFIDHLELMPMTIVTPAFNEENRILNMLYSALNSDYKNVNFIIVNDGSTDRTLELLKKELVLYEVPVTSKQLIETSKIKHYYQSERFKNVTVIDKEHSPWSCGADSINAGLNACQTPIMMTLDADTVVEPEALTRLIYTFLSHRHCVAVSGTVYSLNDNQVANGKMLTRQLPKSFISASQALEHMRSFLYSRSGLNTFGGALCFPGAFTFFETELLHEVKGFDTKNFSYDAEITIKIHHYMRKHNYPYMVKHSSDAFCWTEMPRTWKAFWKQRDKWQRGMLRSAEVHMGMFCNPKYGIVGLLTFPLYILFDIFGPVIEFLTLILFIISLFFAQINFIALAWLILLAWGFITYATVTVLFLNVISFNKYRNKSDSFRAMWLCFTEMLGFRQFRALGCTVSSIRYFINRILGKPI
ncbi:glycosyltransferase family 2 protein [Legionella saoudiensis]|uniref:glycosyltransferase family 2 protein n=1 Tax=Legionella saoudiensis TaxID=1750561 RepID=UPI0007311844|nr:glycosyltransferase family 2 protein [Legionella saoudiensis]